MYTAYVIDGRAHNCVCQVAGQEMAVGHNQRVKSTAPHSNARASLRRMRGRVASKEERGRGRARAERDKGMRDMKVMEEKVHRTGRTQHKHIKETTSDITEATNNIHMKLDQGVRKAVRARRA